ncbi:T9SS type A sorting domain-containing protein [Pontibacter sp. JH31]|uniref:T9SS type A sorting domain-containing protein n=1 Tax=Pontibacter aquaedesilientis TaxID=2766980 RepID=A0ABR7XKB0_9BACT|nr:T9SS type A sorting domain-containing protein [Pontibacter aquaedesilientis]MBD1398737.1 T9SS type A sorting domain-containing protein [Pontibacter aquaedesilientis]
MTKEMAWVRYAKAYILLVFCVYAQSANAQAVEMGSIVRAYTQDFNSLPRTGTQAELGVNAFIPDGWTVHRSPASNVIFVNNGSSNTGGLYSYGHTSSTDRALGALTASGTEITYNLLLQNTSGRTITALDLSYIAEQWRCGSANTDVQRLLFTYAIAEHPSAFNLTVKLNTPGWTTVPSLQFNSPVNKRTAGHVDGNLPQNRMEFSYTFPEAIPSGHYIMLRWYDPDELQQDHGLAIDDVRVSWNFTQDYTPLPVELTKFTARATGNAVELNWTTASEQNSRHFEIERSTDGRQYQTAGIVASQGTTSLITHYAFRDENPLPGVSYYRLKQVDEDMTYAYSKVITVSTGQITSASLYPTIASQEIKLQIPLSQTIYTVMVYDKLGRNVLQQSLLGSSVHTLNISSLGYGNYMLVLLDEAGKKQVMKFLKK